MEETTKGEQIKLGIEYIEVPLDQVVRYFVGGYKISGKDITSNNYFVDTSKGKVILKLFTETKTN